MLGPDTETLEEILSELGKRHIKYGVSPVRNERFLGCFCRTGRGKGNSQSLFARLILSQFQHFFPFMGQAVVYALSETLKDEWTKEIEDAWVEVYDELSAEIMKSILVGLSKKRRS